MNLDTAQAIRESEGKSLVVYEDTLGHATVGIGHLVDPADELVIGDAISEEQCTAFFMVDLGEAEHGAKRICLSLGPQPPQVLHVLICMVFQLGYSGVLRFKKMLAALKRQNYSEAAYEMMDSRWFDQTPKQASRLATTMQRLAVCAKV